MAKQCELYFCEKCGNVVEVLNKHGAPLSCCGEEMKLLEAKTADFATEKHVPVVEKTDCGFTVTVGSTLHPMEEGHYIVMIELNADGGIYRKLLSPGDKPIATFNVCADTATAREYCNKHGLWKS